MSFFPKQQASRQGSVQAVAFSGTAAPLPNAFGSETYQIRLSATAACHYLISEAANVIAATTSNGSLLPANVIEHIVVTPGQRLSVIQDSAAGTLNVTEMS